MSEHRDEATGQFTPSTENLFGAEHELVEAGYVPRPDSSVAGDAPPLQGDEVGSDETSLRELARQKWGDHRNDPIDRSLRFVATGEPVPDNVAQNLEQAAADMSNVHRWEKDSWEQEHLKDVAAEIDKTRAAKIKGDPRLAEHYGLEPDADAAAKTAEKTADATKVDGDGKNLESVIAERPPAVDAPLDPVLDKAIREHPQVRQAVAEEFGKAHQVTEAYSTGLENARVHTLATLAEVVPHLAGLPPQQFEQGLALLSQVDPPAFQQAMNILGRAHTIVQAQQQEQQQRAYAAHQQFENHVRSEDARLIEMVGSKKAADSANQAMLSYLAERGVPRDQMLSVIVQNPVLRTAEARQTVWKAAKYDEMQKAPKAIPKTLPPVQRPGTTSSKGARATEDLHALSAKLNSSGSVHDAYKLYSAKQKARRG